MTKPLTRAAALIRLTEVVERLPSRSFDRTNAYHIQLRTTTMLTRMLDRWSTVERHEIVVMYGEGEHVLTAQGETLDALVASCVARIDDIVTGREAWT